MASWQPSLAVALVAVVLLAGCIGATGDAATTPGGDATTERTTTSADATTSEARPNDSDAGYDSYVFDHYGVDGPAIEGGITHEPGSREARYYATLVASPADADRFNRSVLDEGARQFVDGTDFDRGALVVVQAFPASSVPDYRVEAVSRDGGALHLRINDSSQVATADITVETVLVRVALDGESTPESVTVTTEDGFTFDSTAGVVVREPTTTTEGQAEPDLPYASDDPSENVEEPLDLRIRNDGREVNGYDVTLTYLDVPECRETTPTCGEPTREVTVLRRIGKLQPGGETVVADAVARTGTYRVTVEASLPDGDGGRRTVTETFEWRVVEGVADLTVRITDERVERA